MPRKLPAMWYIPTGHDILLHNKLLLTDVPCSKYHNCCNTIYSKYKNICPTIHSRSKLITPLWSFYTKHAQCHADHTMHHTHTPHLTHCTPTLHTPPPHTLTLYRHCMLRWVACSVSELFGWGLLSVRSGIHSWSSTTTVSMSRAQRTPHVW